MTYYHTAKMRPETVEQIRKNAKSQTDAIRVIFRHNADKMLGATQIQEMLWAAGTQAHITSVRRSLTNLAGEGAIEQTDRTVPTPRGGEEHLYRFIPADKRKRHRPMREQFDAFRNARLSKGVTHEDRIREVERELALRYRKYPDFIDKGYLDMESAARHIEVLESVLAYLKEKLPKQHNLF